MNNYDNLISAIENWHLDVANRLLEFDNIENHSPGDDSCALLLAAGKHCSTISMNFIIAINHYA